MQNKLAAAAGLFAALPGVVLLFLSTSVLQLIGLCIITLGALLGLVSLFSTKASAFGWLALVLSLFTLMLGNGYLPAALGIGLGFTPAVVVDFALSIVLIELSIVSASIQGAYKKYSKELANAGYDSEESNNELGAFSRFMFLAVLGVTVVAGAVFLLFEFVPQIPIDAISGLIIAMIIYFVLATYILRRPSAVSEITKQ